MKIINLAYYIMAAVALLVAIVMSAFQAQLVQLQYFESIMPLSMFNATPWMLVVAFFLLLKIVINERSDIKVMKRDLLNASQASLTAVIAFHFQSNRYPFEKHWDMYVGLWFITLSLFTLTFFIKKYIENDKKIAELKKSAQNASASSA